MISELLLKNLPAKRWQVFVLLWVITMGELALANCAESEMKVDMNASWNKRMLSLSPVLYGETGRYQYDLLVKKSSQSGSINSRQKGAAIIEQDSARLSTMSLSVDEGAECEIQIIITSEEVVVYQKTIDCAA